MSLHSIGPGSDSSINKELPLRVGQVNLGDVAQATLQEQNGSQVEIGSAIDHTWYAEWAERKDKRTLPPLENNGLRKKHPKVPSISVQPPSTYRPTINLPSDWASLVKEHPVLPQEAEKSSSPANQTVIAPREVDQASQNNEVQPSDSSVSARTETRSKSIQRRREKLQEEGDKLLRDIAELEAYKVKTDREIATKMQNAMEKVADSAIHAQLANLPLGEHEKRRALIRAAIEKKLARKPNEKEASPPSDETAVDSEINEKKQIGNVLSKQKQSLATRISAKDNSKSVATIATIVLFMIGLGLLSYGISQKVAPSSLTYILPGFVLTIPGWVKIRHYCDEDR